MATQNKRTWERPTAFYNKYTKYLVYAVVLFFFVWSISSVGTSLSRVLAGLGELDRIVEIALPPNFEPRFVDLYINGLFESLGIALLATIAGIAISIPFSFMGANNIAPGPMYYFARAMFIITRAFHPLIIGIVFVVALGTGAFAGILTFTFGTIGYWAKLLAEDIEDIDDRELDSVRAVGGSPGQIIVYAVVPQILSRAVGLTIYRLDSNVRGSVVIGIVGAGGIGLTLMNSYRQYEYDVTLAILLLIVGIVLVGEVVSAYIRRRVQ
jgi:phosphonate transport system permease protein